MSLQFSFLNFVRISAATLLILLSTNGFELLAQTAPAPPVQPFQRADNLGAGNPEASEEPEVSAGLIKKLEKAISDTVWTGQFTTGDVDDAPKPESYKIRSAVHTGGDDWVINAQIKYGKRNITFPVPVKILWAGRTPVITLDEVTIPPLGTFDARVLIRKGSYAGTWRHGKQGGHLFGKYTKPEKPKQRPQE